MPFTSVPGQSCCFGSTRSPCVTQPRSHVGFWQAALQLSLASAQPFSTESAGANLASTSENTPRSIATGLTGPSETKAKEGDAPTADEEVAKPASDSKASCYPQANADKHVDAERKGKACGNLDEQENAGEEGDNPQQIDAAETFFFSDSSESEAKADGDIEREGRDIANGVEENNEGTWEEYIVPKEDGKTRFSLSSDKDDRDNAMGTASAENASEVEKEDVTKEGNKERGFSSTIMSRSEEGEDKLDDWDSDSDRPWYKCENNQPHDDGGQDGVSHKNEGSGTEMETVGRNYSVF